MERDSSSQDLSYRQAHFFWEGTETLAKHAQKCRYSIAAFTPFYWLPIRDCWCFSSSTERNGPPTYSNARILRVLKLIFWAFHQPITWLLNPFHAATVLRLCSECFPRVFAFCPLPIFCHLIFSQSQCAAENLRLFLALGGIWSHPLSVHEGRLFINPACWFVTLACRRHDTFRSHEYTFFDIRSTPRSA